MHKTSWAYSTNMSCLIFIVYWPYKNERDFMDIQKNIIVTKYTFSYVCQI